MLKGEYVMQVGDFLEKLKPLDREQLTGSKTLSQLVYEDCQAFLKTRKGLQYLQMRYPNLTVRDAALEYFNKTLYITSIV